MAQKPTIKVPTVTLDGATYPLKPGGTADHAGMFVGLHERFCCKLWLWKYQVRARRSFTRLLRTARQRGRLAPVYPDRRCCELVPF